MTKFYSILRNSFTLQYPIAEIPEPKKRSRVIESCRCCGDKISVGTWDSMVGFLVECPHCHGLHGEVWKARRLRLSIFLNLLSFLFFWRPVKALVLMLVLGSIYAVMGQFIANTGDTGVVILGLIIFAGPCCINGYSLLKHQDGMKSGLPRDQVGKLTLPVL
jgi:hypothetical protein